MEPSAYRYEALGVLRAMRQCARACEKRVARAFRASPLIRSRVRPVYYYLWPVAVCAFGVSVSVSACGSEVWIPVWKIY